MLLPHKLGILTLASCLLAAASAAGQQSAYAPYAEPRPLPPSSEPHFPVRMAAAEEPLVSNEAATPLRLSPRSTLGSRTMDRPAPPTPSGAVGTVVASLAIVIGLFLVLAWCSRRFAPAGAAQLPSEVLELLGRSSLNPKQQVQLVRIGAKLLLIAHTAAGVDTLTEITDPEEVERLASLCRRGKPASATNSFTQVLGQIAREPAEPGFAGTSRRGSRGAA
jgi:flagellar biogenesis protein FliO